MNDAAPRGRGWLLVLAPVVCCGAPLLIVLVAAALPAAWAVAMGMLWLVPAALLAPTGYLVWRRRRQARPPPGQRIPPGASCEDCRSTAALWERHEHDRTTVR